ncbi:MAG: peptidylprolyl isomerase [Candidatus Buchananbacteria bacterium]|nr:peptidylprolyl isomerase [Candidatus Buchananbacteria bacterium]
MASKYNLTPERKEELKKEVMEEINKGGRPKMKPQTKKAMPPRAAVAKGVRIEEKKIINPIVKAEMIKPAAKEIKKEVAIKVIEKKPAVKITAPKPVVIKPVIRKEIKKPVKKTLTAPKIKVKKYSPAISAKSETKNIGKEGTAAINSLFKPDSSIKSSIFTRKLFKPKVKIGSKKMFIFGVVACLILAFVVTLAVDIFGIYKLGWNGQISQKVISVLPLPIGTVDGRIIKLSDYYNDLRIVRAVSGSAENDETKEQLFNRLVSVNIIESELKKYGQEVTSDIIDKEMEKVIAQIGSLEKAIEDIKNAYGMDIPTFKNNVLKPILAVDMLNQAVTKDENLAINQEAKKKADEALAIALQPETDFKALVLQYSNDSSTISKSGDLGWFSQGELPKEIEDSLFSLKSGEVYNQVVKDDFGYHVYKIESKLADDSGKESLQISQIFIKVDIELYIKSLFDKAVIKRFI